MRSEIFSLLGNGRCFKRQVPCQIKSVEICRGLFSLALKRLPAAGKNYQTPAPLKAYLATVLAPSMAYSTDEIDPATSDPRLTFVHSRRLMHQEESFYGRKLQNYSIWYPCGRLFGAFRGSGHGTGLGLATSGLSISGLSISGLSG